MNILWNSEGMAEVLVNGESFILSDFGVCYKVASKAELFINSFACIVKLDGGSFPVW